MIRFFSIIFVALSIPSGVLAKAADSIDSRPNDILTIFDCDFDDGWDNNFDLWPDHWTRVTGVRFPQFIKAEIKKLPAGDGPGGKGCSALTVELDGGAFAAYSQPIEASNHYSYQLEVDVQTPGVTNDRAQVTLEFLDAKRRVVRKIVSEPIAKPKGEWTSVRIGPIAPKLDEIAWARVRLATLPGEPADLSGQIRFAKVWMGRLPRLDMKMAETSDVARFGIFKLGQKISIDCTVSGFKSERPRIQFLMKDIDGKTIQSADLRLKVDESDNPNQRLGTVRWSPTPSRAGYYRIYAALENEDSMRCRGESSLAIVESFGWNPDSEFGWSLPHGRGPYTIEQLAALLLRLSNGWVEYPFWYGESTKEEEVEKTLRFIERLSMAGMKMVGLLNDPPPEVRKNFGSPPSLSAAEIFTADPELWYPSLETVLLRLGPRVPYWLLGSHEDNSFVDQGHLQDCLASIMKKIDQTRVDVVLGIPWRWFAMETAWDSRKQGVPAFLSLTADPAMTSQELHNYSQAFFSSTPEGNGNATSKTASSSRYGSSRSTSASQTATSEPESLRVPYRVVLHPLDEKLYPPKVRAADLVQRMLAAKQGGASAILMSDPFAKGSGMLRENGMPDVLLLPWRTTTLTFGGSHYLGDLQLPNGSQNRLFSRGTDVVMAVWNDRPCEESLYLGEDVRIIDIWGHTSKPKMDGNKQIIPVGCMPIFVTGLNPMIAKIRMSVRFEKQKLPAVLNREYENTLVFQNSLPGGVTGKITLHMPDGWKVLPPKIPIQLVQDEKLEQPLNISLPLDALAGKNQVRLDFEIGNRKRYHFSVYRTLQVGQDDIWMEFFPVFDTDGNLTIIQRFVNQTDEPVNFRCQLAVPGRQWSESQVVGSGRGAFEAKHVFPNARDLVGQTVRVRAVENNGLKVLNYEFMIE